MCVRSLAVEEPFRSTIQSSNPIERLQGVWPKIIPVAMPMPIFYVNFSSLNYPNLTDESL